MKSSGPRRTVLLALLGLTFVAVLGFFLRSDQPHYKGKSLFTWIEQHAIASAANDQKRKDEAESAIRDIGTNALPTLLEWITRTDYPLKKKLMANWPFGERARLLMHLEPGHTDHSLTTYACGVLKSEAKPMVPDLARLLTHPDSYVRSSAAFALCQIGPAAEGAVPSLIKSLSDPDAQDNALAALVSIGTKPEAMVAILRAQLSSTNLGQQGWAMSRLAAYASDAKDRSAVGPKP